MPAIADARLLLLSLVLCVAGLGGCKDRPSGTDGGARTEATEEEPSVARELAKSFRGQEVWFVSGFMSQLYDALSEQLEDEINQALQRTARSLNVHLDLPGDRSLELAIGDAVADALPRIDLPIAEGRFMTFYTQMRELDERGIPYRNISLVSDAFNTSQSVEHNAAAIRALLRRTDKKIVFVTHSKGGLDTLHALLGAPELWGKVKGWVAFQSPFYGSPLADATSSPMDGVLLQALGDGDARALEDLKVETRTAYMQAHKSKIRKLARRIPVIAGYTVYESETTVAKFAGTFARGVFSADLVNEIKTMVAVEYAKTPTDVTRVMRASVSEASALIGRRVAEASSAAMATIGVMTLPNAYLRDVAGVPNDGLVPKGSTLLPGAAHRELALGDHASPVMDVDPFRNYWAAEQRNQVTLALIEEVRGGARP